MTRDSYVARVSHHLATAARDMPQSAPFSRLGVLDVLPSKTPRPSARKHHILRHLTGLATRCGEKGGLAQSARSVVVELPSPAMLNILGRRKS